jgi:hypothetical protein
MSPTVADYTGQDVTISLGFNKLLAKNRNLKEIDEVSYALVLLIG